MGKETTHKLTKDNANVTAWSRQVVHDVALQNLPVRFAMDRAGLVGEDGPTHAGAYDVTYMACLPNMVVMAPMNEAELCHMVRGGEHRFAANTTYEIKRNHVH